MVHISKRVFSLRYLWLFSLLTITLLTQAQNLTNLWTGLRSPQPQSELPKGKADFQKAKQKAKQNIPTKLIPTANNEWIISNGWELTDGATVVESQQSIFDTKLDTKLWLNATVPGTILTTLVDQGIYPDPYFGLNNMAIPDTLCRMNWWYRIKFKTPENSKNKQHNIILNGINYAAEVFLNGKKLGNINGAFIRSTFNVTNVIDTKGENVLAIYILPPNNPGISHEQSMIAGQGLNGGQLSLDGPTFISSIGWDWIPGIRDRNIGIWQDVRLKIGGDVLIGDPLVVTDVLLPDTTKANITIRTNVKNITNKTISGTLNASFENIALKQNYSLKPFEEKELVFDCNTYPQLKLDNPRLWWPNGYGKQELYDLNLETIINDEASDQKKIRFGIREMSYELMVNTPEGNTRFEYNPTSTEKPGKPVFDFENRVHFTTDNQLPTLAKDADISGLKKLSNDDPIGPFIVLKVNGVRIFCRGGNWGMDDGMKRVSRERIEPYVKLHKDANFNMIRNWTGESTEEVFYSLCDEYGMLVWNDFWITTDDTVEPNDFELFMANATDVVKRYRNHPSIAIWCPRNEGFAPKGLGVKLSEMTAKEDPTRHYHGQSRFLNMGTSGPWGFFKDRSLYYTQNAKGFNTELGTYAIPTAATIRKFIASEDQWPINDVWAYHDLHHTTQNFDDFINAVNRYGKPKSLDEFSQQAQFVTYESWRSILEAWNSKMWNNTSGLVLWMSHPAWPSMIWQTYTYDYETPASYFGAKKACEPLHIQMNMPDNQIMVINTTLKEFKNLTASVKYIDINGKELHRESKNIAAKANSTTPCFIPSPKLSLPQIYLARIELKGAKGEVISINDYWVSDNDKAYQELNGIAKANIQIKEKSNNVIEISNSSKAIAMSIKLNAIDAKTGEIILPAYFSDGYINLLSGETRKITLEFPQGFSKKYKIVADGYNLTNN